METDASSAPPPETGLTAPTRQRQQHLTLSLRDPILQPPQHPPPPPPPPPPPLSERLPREARTRKSLPRLRKDGEKGKATSARGAAAAVGLARTKLWASSAAAQSKPLLPVTERKSQEEILAVRRAKKGSQDDADKWDITPDGGSAGREGRQFAVANVGNNGRIYLR
ncbi:hypothetical protein QBC44DRAFT_109297 [Cladorrhinum sp. PSN332]|nr:hypothetical protein QBC44DRAFT_109297 [Cladorrhinum sp. PSN332]